VMFPNDQCYVCGSNHQVTVPSGEILCECCGIVISEKTEESAVTSTTGGRDGDDDVNKTGILFR
jgi:transcription initiation factor TFIIIB Brf1 subunit/transcription initiation factor TFIIB